MLSILRAVLTNLLAKEMIVQAIEMAKYSPLYMGCHLICQPREEIYNPLRVTSILNSTYGAALDTHKWNQSGSH